MFRSQAQRVEACRTLLGLVDLSDKWGDKTSPSNALWDTIQETVHGSDLSYSSGEVAIMQATVCLWNGSGEALLKDCLNLDTKRQKALWTLLLAVVEGPDAVDAWIQTWKGVEP